MFRNEKPQLGRNRQFHQLGVEYFNSTSSIFDDLELILITEKILGSLGLKEQVELRVNSIGSADNREQYSSFLREWLKGRAHLLSEEGRAMALNNPMRLLDTKREQDQSVISEARNQLERCLIVRESARFFVGRAAGPTAEDDRTASDSRSGARLGPEAGARAGLLQ